MMYEVPKELPLFLGERHARSLTAESSLVRQAQSLTDAVARKLLIESVPRTLWLNAREWLMLNLDFAMTGCMSDHSIVDCWQAVKSMCCRVSPG